MVIWASGQDASWAPPWGGVLAAGGRSQEVIFFGLKSLGTPPEELVEVDWE